MEFGYEMKPLVRLSGLYSRRGGAAGCSLSQLWLIDVYRAGHAGKKEDVHHAAWTGLNLSTTGVHAQHWSPESTPKPNVRKREISEQTRKQRGVQRRSQPSFFLVQVYEAELKVKKKLSEVG